MTASTDIPTTETDLFGGAITAHFPSNFEDASQFREVPNTQEVYVSRTYDTDISIIVDICERVSPASDPSSDSAAVAVHWDDITLSDDRCSNKVFTTTSISLPNLPGVKAYSIVGTVSSPQNSTQPPLFTAILVTVVRLEQQKTDIVITVNVPFLNVEHVRAEGSVAAPGWEGELNGVPGELLSAGLAVRDKVLASFKIKDWDLFVPEE
ncbi:hypothetical protein FN846DRAFT_976590 [Sphaerosporella brunnea]|uniref:Uncharacterized protein n=1 Tax=Sphaerosporella brunnea TaxID=1250544 RepID=A0A5J5EG94_9PEZI|nr:hypothetical protein FN846DRAFT_976590 [Sphaerosporella brunnea]